jgi:hypothetical protein
LHAQRLTDPPSRFDSYGAGIGDLALAASATDVFCINGSATRTIYITDVHISGSATSAARINVSYTRRSTANSGGTSTTLTNIPDDSQSPAGTAVVKAYTANPTLGTSVGVYSSGHNTFPADAAPNIAINELTRYFGSDNAKLFTLRGTSEGLCLNFNGETVTGGLAHISVHWIEQ